MTRDFPEWGFHQHAAEIFRLRAINADLLAALEGLLAAMDREDDAASWRNHEVEAAARAAILKARGE